MKEADLRALIEDVRTEKLPRRSFIERLVGLGLSAPMASMLLMHAGVAQSQPAPVYKPTKRGGGGALKVLWWQGATLLQPHFAWHRTRKARASSTSRCRLGQRRQPGADPRRRDPDVANGGVLEGGKVVRWR
jgi:peptide/nickel transport system substrate-binding protein